MQLNATLEEENKALMDQVNKLLQQVQIISLLNLWFTSYYKFFY